MAAKSIAENPVFHARKEKLTDSKASKGASTGKFKLRGNVEEIT